MADSSGRARLWRCLDAALVGVGFWLVGPVPVALVDSPYDAGLFVRLANSLLAGQWLGRFDALTLAKGPFYPMFLAGCAAAGVPIQAGIEAVYLAGALVMARVVAVLTGRAGAGTLCLALLVFNPACTDWSVGALMREPLYGALSLLVMALTARMCLCRGGVWSGAALGAAGAAFWLTREEGVLLVPPLAVLAAWHVRGLWRGLRGGAAAWALLGPPLVALGVAGMLVAGVCAINQYDYGVFRSNDFQAGPFARAYGALSRIVPDTFQRLTPVSRDMRNRAYAVSPAAREVQPYLDAEAGPFLTDVLCPQTGRPACHDIAAASFMWALRDAVARAGYYGSARRADGYYKRLAREIGAACARAALPCLPARAGYVPRLDVRDAGPLLRSLAHVSWDVLLLGRAGPLVMPGTAEGPAALAYAAVTRGSVIAPPLRFIGAPAWQITGVLRSADPTLGLHVGGPPGTSIMADLRPAPAQAGAPGHVQAFSLEARCAPGDCRLEVAGAGAQAASWPLAGLRARTILDVPGATLTIDGVQALPAFTRQVAGDLRGGVMRGAAWLLRGGSCLGTPVAVVWLVVGAVRARRLDAAFVLAVALALAVVLRVALLALLDATSIERQFRYESPAVTLLLAFLACAASWRRRLGALPPDPVVRSTLPRGGARGSRPPSLEGEEV